MEDNHKDFRTSCTFRFFNNVLCALFEKRMFRPIYGSLSTIESINETNEHRYVKYFVRDFYDIHGRRLQNEIKFTAIPMGERILVCHSKVKGRYVTIRAKTECFDDDDPIRLKETQALFIRNMVDRVLSMCGITLEDLPNDVKLYIIKNLDLASLVNLAKSNHYWYRLIKENNWLWKIIFKRDFGQLQLSAQDTKAVMNWKGAYERESQHRRQMQNERRRWIHNALPPLPYLPALPFNEHHFRPNMPDDLIHYQPYRPIRLFWHDEL